MRVPFSEWLPDQPDLDNPGMTVASNVFPKTATSYGPIKAPVNTTGAITGRCLGAAFGKSSAGNVTVFSGDENDLYKLSSTAWQAVSKSVTATQGYTTGSGEYWRFIQYGDELIATNYTDPL